MANPTGTDSLDDNGGTLGRCVTGGHTSAPPTTSTLATASHPITAAYTSGDSNFNVSAPSAALSQVVNPAGTSTAVAASVNPSVSGQRSEERRAGKETSPATSAVANPTGTVTFYDNGVALGSGSLSGTATDTATFTTSTPATASHPITSTYTSGDSNFNVSAPSAALSQVVNPAGTSTAVAASVNPSVSGQAVTFTATVSITGPATSAVANQIGRASCRDSGEAPGSAGLSATATATFTTSTLPTATDTATFTTSTLATASHPIAAAHTRGDSNVHASAPPAALSQVVNPAGTSTAVAASVNPSVSGQAVTFTATVSITGPATSAVANPTGTVTFYDNGVALGSGSWAHTSTPTITCSLLPTASHPI